MALPISFLFLQTVAALDENVPVGDIHFYSPLTQFSLTSTFIISKFLIPFPFLSTVYTLMFF